MQALWNSLTCWIDIIRSHYMEVSSSWQQAAEGDFRRGHDAAKHRRQRLLSVLGGGEGSYKGTVNLSQEAIGDDLD